MVSIGGTYVYPIFRVGYTSLMEDADMVFTDREIDNCPTITVLLRDPKARFISGVNEYCRQNNLDVESTWNEINLGRIHDRHFTPQYVWLLHLYKFYKGFVTIRPFKHISNVTEVHIHKSESKIEVPVIESFVAVDRHLTNYYNETVNIGYLIKRYKHALS